MHPQPVQHSTLDAAARRADARTRVSAGRYRATPAREPAPPRPRHATPAPSPALVHQDTTRVVGAAVLATAALAAFDVALTGRLSMFFDLCFVLVGLSAALVVRRRGLYAVGVLPPLLLGALVAVLAVTWPATLTASHLAFVSTWLTGLAHHGVALGATHVVVLAIVGLRAGQQPPRATTPPDARER